MLKNLGSLFVDFEDATIEDETGTLSLQNTTGISYNTIDYKYGSSSISFSGSNSNIVFSSAPSLNIGYNDYTVDVWMKRSTVDTFDAVFNIGNYLGNSRSEGLLILLFADSDLIGYYKSNFANTVSVPRTTEWMHFAITRSSAVQRIFINGTLISTEACTADIQSNSNGVTIGSYGNISTKNPFVGLMDNFRIVNNEALWTESFDITEAALGYVDDIKIPTSNIYHTKKTKMRGKAAEGFIRPTITEFFTSKDFEEILKTPPPTVIGQIYEGGYYMGTLGGYYLVCSPGATGQTTRAIKTVNTATPDTQSFSDGYANTQAMMIAGSAPAAEWCTSLTIGGFSDWYIPAYSELSLMRANYVALEAAGAGTFFGGGGSSGHQWASTEEDSLHNYYMRFADGSLHDVIKTGVIWVRPIRRVAV